MLTMMNQGGEPKAAVNPNSMEIRSVDEVSQGHAPVIAGHYTWPSSTGQMAVSWNYGANSGPLENATSSSSINHYDPLRDSSCAEGAHCLTSSAPQTSTSSNLSAANGSPAYGGYVPYSNSTYAYGYENMQYQNNYYVHPQQTSYTSFQQAGASQNTGASYQPHSSFQNTGSYATPSYSGAYFASDHQTVAGYPTTGYVNQTNYWNEGSGSYPLQYANYPSSNSNSTMSTSNAATSLYPYQQECNQWSVNYSASATNVNCTPGSSSMVASTLPTATYPPFQSTNSSYLYASSQPPPPGTTSWRGDLASSTLPSSQAQNDVVGRLPNGSWEQKAPTEQTYHLNQISSELQKPLDSKLLLFENHDTNGKTACSYNPTSSLQVFSTSQVSLYPQQPVQAVSAIDSCRVSKIQIPTNPRIASSLAAGMPKLDKEISATSVTAKPAYISVQVPKLNNQSPSSDDADTVVKGAFPPSVRSYAERCFSRCKDDAQRSANKIILSEIIGKAKEDSTLWTKNWDVEPLFPLPNSNPNAAERNILQSTVLYTPKVPSRRIKSRWEPVAEERLEDIKVAPVSHDSTKNVNWAERMIGSPILDNGRNSMKFSLPQPSPLNNTIQRPLKKSRFSDISNIIENGKTSSDSDKEQELTKHYSSAIALENSPEERKRREHRSKRFEKGQERQSNVKQFKTEGAGVGNILRRANALLLAKSYDDQCSRAVEDIYWDALTVKGTCQEVEKRYLRLTSAPDPATVRPEEILEKALYMIQTSQKNYLYKCDQLKSIRQDLTVQRIQNELTVKVYETHGRLALEAGDLPEFNQCQSQLKRLYAEGIKGCQMEFSAYNLLCVILHSNNKRDLLSSIKSLSNAAKQDEIVKHALAVHSAVSSGNYVLFFRLYKAAPNLITCLMDLHVEKMRFEAIKCMSKSYRPIVPVTYIANVLGFSTSVQTCIDGENGANGLEDCEEWLRAHGAVLIVENNVELQLDTKASSSALYMPEPEDAVAHGDAHLAVDDFFTRTS